MKMSMIALATALSMGAAIPAFADQGPPVETSASLPQGFYRGVPVQARLGQPQNNIDSVDTANGYYRDHSGQRADGVPHATENLGVNG